MFLNIRKKNVEIVQLESQNWGARKSQPPLGQTLPLCGKFLSPSLDCAPEQGIP
jgi:hypothetical protein